MLDKKQRWRSPPLLDKTMETPVGTEGGSVLYLQQIEHNYLGVCVCLYVHLCVQNVLPCATVQVILHHWVAWKVCMNVCVALRNGDMEQLFKCFVQ